MSKCSLCKKDSNSVLYYTEHDKLQCGVTVEDSFVITFTYGSKFDGDTYVISGDIGRQHMFNPNDVLFVCDKCFESLLNDHGEAIRLISTMFTSCGGDLFWMNDLFGDAFKMHARDLEHVYNDGALTNAGFLTFGNLLYNSQEPILSPVPVLSFGPLDSEEGCQWMLDKITDTSYYGYYLRVLNPENTYNPLFSLQMINPLFKINDVLQYLYLHNDGLLHLDPPTDETKYFRNNSYVLYRNTVMVCNQLDDNTYELYNYNKDLSVKIDKVEFIKNVIPTYTWPDPNEPDVYPDDLFDEYEDYNR